MEQEKKHRRHFDREFKLDAVKLVTSGKRPLAEVARELGVRPDLLRKWKAAVRQACRPSELPREP